MRGSWPENLGDFEPYPTQTGNALITSAFLLAGLRVSQDEVRELFGGVQLLEESTSYMLSLEQGKTKALKRVILRLGQHRFGSIGDANKRN
ncbi:MAG: hypothetical protein ACFCD0_09915 [Gemmataceae bacterium]